MVTLHLTLSTGVLGPDEYRINALWGVYEGKYQVWYDTATLTSRSYYLDFVPESLHQAWVPMMDVQGKPSDRLYRSGDMVTLHGRTENESDL